MSQSPLDSTDTYCMRCSSALRDATGARCPECSAAFDPQDPATFAILPLSGLSRWFIRPPGFVTFTVAIVSSIVGCYGAAIPGGLQISELAAFAGWMLVGFMVVGHWILRLVIIHDHFAARPRGLPRLRPRWLVLLALLGATVFLYKSGLPFYAGFQFSRPGLQHIVDEAMATPPGSEVQGGKVGVFRVTRVWRDERYVNLECVGVDDVDPLRGMETYGFTYAPAGGPAPEPHGGRSPAIEYTPIGDDWYLWREYYD